MSKQKKQSCTECKAAFCAPKLLRYCPTHEDFHKCVSCSEITDMEVCLTCKANNAKRRTCESCPEIIPDSNPAWKKTCPKCYAAKNKKPKSCVSCSETFTPKSYKDTKCPNCADPIPDATCKLCGVVYTPNFPGQGECTACWLAKPLPERECDSCKTKYIPRFKKAVVCEACFSKKRKVSSS